MNKVQSILEAATVLFARNGYEGTSVAEIAIAAGVANGTVIYHFKSKENLLHVIAWNTLTALHRQLHAELVGARNGLESVHLYIKGFFVFVDANHDGVLNFLGSHPREAARRQGGSVGPDILALRFRMLEMLAECVRRGMTDGSIREVFPEQVASGLAATLIGSAWLMVFNNLDARSFLEEALALATSRLAREAA